MAERTVRLQQVVDEMQLVTDGVASLIARFDLEGNILYANRRYHEFFGLQPGHAVGKRVAEVAGPAAQQRWTTG